MNEKTLRVFIECRSTDEVPCHVGTLENNGDIDALVESIGHLVRSELSEMLLHHAEVRHIELSARKMTDDEVEALPDI